MSGYKTGDGFIVECKQMLLKLNWEKKKTFCLPPSSQMSKKHLSMLQTHLLVFLPAFERCDNILVESRGDGL